ncbi:hypothetical protein FCH79_19795 [Pseudomonas koreensis]|nr:hypothetical protein [Pseudomonas koreensis]
MARKLAPAGLRSAPKKSGLLRSPAGASSLATESGVIRNRRWPARRTYAARRHTSPNCCRWSG